MKKLLSLFLVICLLFSMVACSSGLSVEESETQGNAETNNTTAENAVTNEKEEVNTAPIVYPEGFSVGYGRKVVNPANGTGLGGYSSADTRLSRTILDDLKLTCTALCDGENVLLVFSSDLPYIGSSIVIKASDTINKNYGIPASNVIFNITHTHSGPALLNTNYPGMAKYAKLYYAAVNEVAGEALRDLEEATILVGRGETDGLNYVRRYVSLEDGSYLGKNLSSGQDPTKVGHETQADEEMQIIKFDRATKKDVVLCNWQCHPTGPGGTNDVRVSADWIGALRDEVEKEADVLFSYHQGGAGNIGPGSPITGENNFGGERFVEHGKLIAQTALSILNGNLTPLEAGKVQAKQFVYTAEFKPEIVSGKQKQSYSKSLTLSALSIGEIAFAACVGEPHDTMGKTVKTQSPFKMTFFCGYTDGYVGYIPADFAYANGGYEVDSTNYAKGTGEAIVAALLEELNTQYAAR